MSLIEFHNGQMADADEINANFEYVESLGAMSKQFAHDTDSSAGLAFAFFGGAFRNDNVITNFAGGSVALTDNSMNYVEVDAGGVTTNTTGFTSGKAPLYMVATADGAIDVVSDLRSWAFLANSPGDMLKSVYDTNNSGVVDYAEGVDWSDVDNKPSEFAPSAHANEHGKGGDDELALSAEQIVSDTMDVARLPVMTGATSIVAGESGMVPAPAAGDDSKVLYGDGVYRTPPGATGTVSSVNGRTGAVVLDNTDVGLDNVTNDAQVPLAAVDNDPTFAANSDDNIPTQKAVRTAFSNTLKMTESQTQNRVLAAPVSANGTPSFRALDIADLPFVDNDGDLTADSDSKLATQKAVKYYVDNNSGGGGGISKVEDDTTPKLGGNLDAASKKIINLAAPTADGDAANKKYVDDNLNPLALGETSSTAYRGDRGAAAYSHSQLTSGNPHGVTKSDIGLGNVTNDAQLKASMLDTDANLAADSDSKIPTQKAVKAYVDANAGGESGLELDAAEALAKWDFVGIDASGKLVKADASLEIAAIGFVDAAVAQNATAKVLLSGIVEGQSGLTAGDTYYLGTGGATAATPPQGGIVQVVGISNTTSSLIFILREVVE